MFGGGCQQWQPLFFVSLTVFFNFNMSDKEDKSLSQEFLALVLENAKLLLQWFKPNAADSVGLKVLKFVIKLPVMLFILLVSPVLLIILGIIFVILL